MKAHQTPEPGPASGLQRAKLPLSCYIRTRNEGKRIARCVGAAFQVADEVIVVDSGSTDDTVELAELAGARVIAQPWLGWGRQKRIGEDHCRNDYLLDVDADEVVSPELAEEIRTLFAHGTPPLSVYTVDVVTIPPGGEDWPRFLIVHRNRLYDRRVVRAPDHETADQLVTPPNVRIGRLKGELLHYSYQNLDDLVAKFNGTSSALALRGKPKSVALRVLFGLPFYFLRHLFLRGMFRGGVYGVAIAGIAAYGRWLRDAKMHERYVTGKKRQDS